MLWRLHAAADAAAPPIVPLELPLQSTSWAAVKLLHLARESCWNPEYVTLLAHSSKQGGDLR